LIGDGMSQVDTRGLTLLAVAGFASAAAFRICDPLLPKLAQAFETTTGSAARVITAFSIAYGLLQLLYGPIGDRYGKYRVVATATLACTVGSVGCATVGSLNWLILFRVIAGATAAGIVPLSMAWIGDTVPYAQRQATLARFLTGTIMGMAGGQFIGGFFADTLGWRWSFVLLAACYIAVGLLLHAELKRHAVAHTGPSLRPMPASSPQFVAQMRSVLQNRWARIILLTVCLEGTVVFGTLAFIPAYLHTRFDLSLTAAGAIVGIYGMGGLVYTFLVRRLIPRFGEPGLALGGGLILCAAFAGLLFGSAWPWALLASFAAGLGFYMLHNTLQTHATQMAPAARGTAVSLFSAALFMGQSVGVAIAAVIVDVASASWLFGIAAIALPLLGFAFARLLRDRQLAL